jgi:DNA-directed RNA polymerase specialized sigma24 family protein
MLSATTEFAELIDRVKAGDDLAMAELMKQHESALLRTARTMIGRNLQSSLDSVDLVQSVQMMLWLGLRTGKFSLPTPQHWLGLAKVLLKRKVARFCRNNQAHASLDGALKDTVSDMAIFPPPAENDPGRLAEFDDLVEHFLNQLDGVDRELVRLRFEGHSTAEAARRLNLDAGVLRVRLGRLRTRFGEFRKLLTTTPVEVPVIEVASE